MRLYEMTDTYASLISQYEDAQSDAEREELLKAIVETEGDIALKAENYARLIKNAQADADALKVEIDRLTAKKQKADRLVQRLKDYLLFAMGIAGATEIKTAIGSFKVAQNPPKVCVVDINKVPVRFLIEQPPKVDARAIIAEHKETGELFDGIEIERKESVRFR